MKVNINLVISVAALLMSFSGIIFPIHPDEGVYLSMASFINKGYLPYRDFFDHKPPGIYYVLVPLISVLGNSIIFSRLLVSLINLFTSFFIYKYSAKFVNRQKATLGALFYLFLLPLLHGNFVLTESFLNLFFMMALYSFEEKNSKNIPLRFFISGLIVSFSVYFKQSAILYIPFFLLLISLGIFADKNRSGKAWRFLLGLAIGQLPMMIFLIKQGILKDFIDSAWLFNLNNYHPEIFIKTLAAYTSVLFPLTFIWLAFFKELFAVKLLRFHLIMRLFLICYLPIIIFRPYHHYLLPLLPFVSIVTALDICKKDLLAKLVKINLVVIFFSQIIFTFSSAYPELKRQIISAGKKQTCSAELQAYEYFLTDSVPQDKYFYSPVLLDP